MRRPFVDGNSLETLTRLTHRHSSLFLEHKMVPYPGPTVEIITEEFDTAGGTSVLRPGLSHDPHRMRIDGVHIAVLTEPGPISEALMELFRQLEIRPGT